MAAEIPPGETPAIDGDEANASEHSRIAAEMLDRWGGLAAGLPLLGAALDEEDEHGLRHLVWHLAAAGRDEDVHRLLACERPAPGRAGMVNAWFDARDRIGQADSYLADLEIARRLARKATDTAIAAGRTAPSLGLEMRYALMAICARFTGTRTYGELPPMLVEAGIWDVTRALTAARREDGHERRAEYLAALLPHLPAKKRQPVLRELLHPGFPKVLREVWPQLKANEFAEVLTVLENDDLWYASHQLEELAPHLPPELLGRAITLAAALPLDDRRDQALAALAPHLPPALARAALPAATELRDGRDRAHVLSELIPRLLDQDRPEPLAALRAAVTAIDPQDEARLWRWGELLALLPAANRPAALADLPTDPWDRAELLMHAAERVPVRERPPLSAAALTAAHDITDPLVRARVLIQLAELLPLEEQAALLAEARTASRRISEPPYGAWVLTEMFEPLPADQRHAVLAEALMITRSLPAYDIDDGQKDWDDRARLLMEISTWLSPDEAEEVLAEAFDLIRAVDDEDQRFHGLLAVAELLTGRRRHTAMAEALDIRLKDIGYENYFHGQLARMAPLLPEDLMVRALNELHGLNRPGYLGRTLLGVAEHLSGLAVDRGLDISRRLTERPHYQAAALAALADRLPSAERRAVLSEAEAMARKNRQGMIHVARRVPPERRTALLAEELSFRQRGFRPEREEALASLPDEAARPVPFAYVPVPILDPRWDEDGQILLRRAQRAWRRGEGRTTVIGIVRTALEKYGHQDPPGSAALTSAARDLGGALAECEYRRAVHDIYRWWP
ncbi:hypothetical protein [Nonomuraea insulae]|uniref:HEAT repeat protein n=1 Tax=Nonomuraea insulae TaxID=1616787 RepID=A0ABW1D2E4_9ACTN